MPICLLGRVVSGGGCSLTVARRLMMKTQLIEEWKRENEKAIVTFTRQHFMLSPGQQGAYWNRFYLLLCGGNCRGYKLPSLGASPKQGAPLTSLRNIVTDPRSPSLDVHLPLKTSWQSQYPALNGLSSWSGPRKPPKLGCSSHTVYVTISGSYWMIAAEKRNR